MIDKALKNNIRLGSLSVRYADGRMERYGQGLPAAEWHFHDEHTPARIVRDPELALGETYMDGGWSTPPGQLPILLGILMRNFSTPGARALRAGQRLARYLQQLNRIARSYRNVAHHYDLDEWLFRRFLDRDMIYSCAYFADPNWELEQAQRAKCDHIMRKLALRPGQQVLDIGCGWGALALHLAEQAGVHVTGITLSKEQLRVAQQRARERGLADRVRFLLQDYREHLGRYDRIVSVGMFEHVGVPNYRTFFDKVQSLLAQPGLALLHTIGRVGPPARTNAWIRKHIFPGGYIPALSEVAPHIERAGLGTADVEVLRLHYSYTLAHWQKRFQSHRPEVVDRMGERFARMWEFYLAACEAAFRHDLVVFQIQLGNSLELPANTRDYLYRPNAGAGLPAADNAPPRTYTYDS